MSEHLDVLIVGAGLSGIGAAHHLQRRCPGKSYAILEAREATGGTWDLFRYPGIRSDSDMYTLGYNFKPWTDRNAIADGDLILDYIRETAQEAGIDRRIRLQHKVVAAEWSTPDARWTVTVERGDSGETVQMTCDFLYMCSGYYRYDQGYTPEFPGIEGFGGTVVHPQHWPEDLDYEGKRVVVIGSGATAVTLVPALAKDAAKVTMLQRSPTYIASMPAADPVAHFLHRFLPARAVYPIVRWKNVLAQLAIYKLSRTRPGILKKLLRRGVERMLPPGYDVDTHFTPRYNPWDQRLCLVPDADLFKAIGEGSAEVVTDRIAGFDANGIELESGKRIDADVVVTATGLNVLFLGEAQLRVDGVEPNLAKTWVYKGMMLNDIPNFAFTLGYTNASWTLKADLVAEYVCRLINHLDAGGYDYFVPEVTDPTITEEPLLDFNSGYVLRALDVLPKQGSKEPWKLKQSYPYDLRAMRRGNLLDGSMQFRRRTPDPATAKMPEWDAALS